MPLYNRIDELETDIAKLEAELSTKDAIITEALSSYSSIPPQPNNFALIETILGIHIKQKYSHDSELHCRLHSTFIYDDFLCILAEVNNSGDFRAIVSSLCISCSFEGTGFSGTAVAVFDGLTAVKFIEKSSERRVVISLPKGVLMEKDLLLEIEFQLIASESSIDSRLLRVLPPIVAGNCMRKSFFFTIQYPVKAFFREHISDITVEDGVLLYQAIYGSFTSREVELNVSKLSSSLRYKETFKTVDFGDWQLMLGIPASVHGGLVVACLSSFYGMIPRCRIFARNFLNLDRFELYLRSITDEAQL